MDDAEIDGPQASIVTVAVNPSSDPNFVGEPDQTLVVTTQDNDAAGFAVTESGGSTVVSETGTEVRVRGGAEAVNQFGLSCADCHALAAPQWDFICEQTHGCDPLPIGPDVFALLQSTDPRPRLADG